MILTLQLEVDIGIGYMTELWKNNQKFLKVGSTFADIGILDPPSASAEQH